VAHDAARQAQREARQTVVRQLSLFPTEFIEKARQESWSPAQMRDAFQIYMEGSLVTLSDPARMIEFLEAVAQNLTIAAACQVANIPYLVARWWIAHDAAFRELIGLAQDAAVDLVESVLHRSAIRSSPNAVVPLLRGRRREIYQPPSNQVDDDAKQITITVVFDRREIP